MTKRSWVVVLECSTRPPEGDMDEDAVQRLLEGLRDLKAVALHSPERYAVQMEIAARDHADALAIAVGHWHGAVERLGQRNPPMLRAEVLTLDEFERDCLLAYESQGGLDAGADPIDAPEAGARARDEHAGDRLLWQVFHDPLTQLPGQGLFMDHLERNLLRICRARGGRGVLILKLTELDRVNQEWGRSAGDEVLVAAVRRLRAVLPRDHSAARLGGDELAVPLEAASERDAIELANTVVASLDQPTLIGDIEVSVPVRAGIAFGRRGQDVEELVAEARAALRASELSQQIEIYRPGLPAAERSGAPAGGGHDPMGYLLLLQRAAIAANESSSLTHAAGLVVSQVCAHIGWPLGHLHVVEPGGELLPGRLPRLGTSPYQALHDFLDHLSLPAGAGLAGRVVETGRAAWIADISAERAMPWSAVATASGLHAALAFPVLVGREVVAVLEFFAREAGQPDDALLEVLRGVGSQLGRVVERRRAQDDAQLSEDRMREAQSLAQLGSWHVDGGRGAGTWSDGMSEILGVPPDVPHTTEFFMQLVCPEDRPLVQAAIDAAIATGRSGPLEFRILRPDGQLRWVCARTNSSRDGTGAVVGVYGTILDITHVKVAEDDLRKRERQLSMAEAVAEMGSWERDIASGRIEWSDGMFRLWGADHQSFEPTLDVLVSRIHPDDRERVRRSIGAATDTGGSAADFRITPAHGGVRWFRSRAVAHYDDEGRPVRLVGTIQDVTREKVVEQDLLASERRHRAIVAATRGGVWVTDAHGTITYVNARTAELLGRSPEELLGRSAADFMDGEGEAAFRRPEPARGRQFETTVIRGDGTLVPVQVGANPLVDGYGRYIGALTILDDVSAPRGGGDPPADDVAG